MLKYAVYPGHVISKTDRDRRHITFRKLCKLYRVGENECVDMSQIPNERQRIGLPRLIPLHPDPKGKYELPDCLCGYPPSAHFQCGCNTGCPGGCPVCSR